MILIAVSTLLILAPLQARFASDTTFPVSPGAKLRIHNQGGDIIVTAWDKNQVRVQADHSSRSYVDVDIRGSVVEITTKSRRGAGGTSDYTVTVPAWMGLDLGGMYAEISIDGVRGPVKASTLEGNITLRGGGESISLETVNGRIEASGARGRVSLHAVSDDVIASDIQGDLSVESVSGSIDLRGIDAKSVDAQTVSGDVTFDGRVTDGGTYAFVTHSGDVTLALPDAVNATVSVASGSGDVTSSFTLKAERETRRRHVYRLGNGGATLDIETFSGDVDLVRPGELKRRPASAERDHQLRIKVKNKNRKHDPDSDDDEEPDSQEDEQ